MTRTNIKEQARLLAQENREAEPHIEKVYWFPDAKEIRLIELHPDIPESSDGELHPCYFKASPKDNLDFVSAIALIKPEEFKKLKLPDNWGDWDSAVKLEVE